MAQDPAAAGTAAGSPIASAAPRRDFDLVCRGRFLQVVDYEDIGRAFLLLQPESQLFLQRREDRRPGVGVSGGSTTQYNGPVSSSNSTNIGNLNQTTATAQNGVEVNVGAKGTLTNNVIAGVDYTPTSSNGTGILFYQAAANSEANDNTISDANVGIEFYEANNGTANGNNISKAFNWNALVAVANHTEFEHNVIADAGLQQAQPAVYLCGSNNKVENNTISEAIIGVQDDRTSADDCSGSTGNTKSANVYTNVGTDSETLTDEPTPAAHSLNHNNRNSAPRPLPKP